MRRITNVTDLVSGFLLIGLGLFALSLSKPLRLGTATQMGPGYVPHLLSYIQMALGALVAVRGVATTGEGWEAWVPRPIIWILAGVAYIAVAIETLGLVAAVIGLVVLSCLAHRGTKPLHAVLLGCGLAVFSVLVFVKALQLPILVWPAVLGS